MALGLFKTPDGRSRIHSMAISPNGATLYVAGKVSGIGTFDCGAPSSYDIPVMGQYGSSRAFVAAIDLSVAECAWAKVYEGDTNANQFAIRIGVSSAGDPVVTIPYLTNGPIGSNAPQLGPDDWGTIVAKISPFSGDFIKSATIMGEFLSRLNQMDGVSSAWYAFTVAQGGTWIPKLSWGPAGLAFGEEVEAIIDLGHGPIDAYSGANVLAARFFPLP